MREIWHREIVAFLLCSVLYPVCANASIPSLGDYARIPLLRNVPSVHQLGRLHRQLNAITNGTARQVFYRHRFDAALVQAPSRQSRKLRQLSHDIRLYNYVTFYTGYIGVGSPAMQFAVIFDTGSADFWVQGRGCGRNQGCYGESHYDPGMSSTSRVYRGCSAPPCAFEITYGSGYAQGTLVQDSVTVGGYVAGNQVFGQAQALQGFSIPSGSHQDGLLGLGFPDLSSTQFRSTPVFDNLLSQTALPRKIFSFDLGTVSGDDGHMYIGAVVPNVPGPWHAIPALEPRDWWRVPMTSIGVRGGSNLVGSCSTSSSCSTIVDTGTSYIMGPQDQVGALVALLQASAPNIASNQWNCDGFTKLPTLEMTFTTTNGDSVVLSLAPEHYVNLKYAAYGQCFLAFGALSGGHGPDWILGDSFLRAYYSVFDRDNNEILFAATNHSTTYTVPSATGSTSSGSWNMPLIIGVAVGAAGLVFAMVAMVIWLMSSRQRSHHAALPTPSPSNGTPEVPPPGSLHPPSAPTYYVGPDSNVYPPPPARSFNAPVPDVQFIYDPSLDPYYAGHPRMNTSNARPPPTYV